MNEKLNHKEYHSDCFDRHTELEECRILEVMQTLNRNLYTDGFLELVRVLRDFKEGRGKKGVA